MRRDCEVISTTPLTRAPCDRELERRVHLKEQAAGVLLPAVKAYLAFAREYWDVFQPVEGEPARVA